MSAIADEQVDAGVVEESKLEHWEPPVPRNLYLLWEGQHWASSTLDFARDREDWAAMPEEQRSILVRSMAPFFAGEERGAAVLSPIILAADDEQERAFLATQQVDEVRHTQFFSRFWSEVFVQGEATSRAVADARARCNDAFTELFERRLGTVIDRLRMNPRDTDAKVEAVAILHLIVEATFALTGLHFVVDYFRRNAVLPAIAEGLAYVKRDEHRHVAWGTWYLRSKCREDDHYGNIVQNTLLELLPVATAVFVQEGSALCDGMDHCEFLGYSSAELNYWTLNGLARRLKVIGGATKDVQKFAASGAWRASRVMSTRDADRARLVTA